MVQLCLLRARQLQKLHAYVRGALMRLPWLIVFAQPKTQHQKTIQCDCSMKPDGGSIMLCGDADPECVTWMRG